MALLRAVVEIEQRIEHSKADLTDRTAEGVVRKHVIDGDCFALGKDEHFGLREDVAAHFNVTPAEVVLVGSGKLGLSVAPGQQYQLFHDESDIDVAVVSASAFESLWNTALDYWDKTRPRWQDHKTFARYLFRGKIYPDHLPPRERFPPRDELDSFFEELTSSGRFGPYPIGTAHVYRSWNHLELYQVGAVRECQQMEERRRRG